MNFANKGKILVLSAIGFLLSLQLGFTTFIDSSYLSKLLSSQYDNSSNIVGYVFAFSYLISLISIVFLPKILRSFGAVKILNTSNILLPIALITLFFEPSIILAFISYFVVTICSITILATSDILLSSYAQEKDMGVVRGIYFTLISLGFMISPAISGMLVESRGLPFAYLAGAICTISLIFFSYFSFKNYKDETYEDVPVFPNKELRNKSADLMPIFLAHFSLQAFYAVMTIYAPIYLIGTVGISRDNFGIIITIALSTFVVMPTILGYIADKLFGEKEMIIIGMLLMGGSLISIPIFANYPQTIFFWGVILFISRIGATMTESMTDTFFFKKIEHAHPSLISFYRRARPLALLSVPAFCSVLLSLNLIDISQVFFIVGFFIIIMIFQAYKLVDTK